MIITIKIFALVTGIADLGYILNLARSKVPRVKFAVPGAEIAFTAVTTHIQTGKDRRGDEGGHS